MRYIVPFSGGFDSLYLLETLATESKGTCYEHLPGGKPIVAISVFSKSFLQDQTDAAREAVEKLIPMINKRHPDIEFCSIEVESTIDKHHMRRGLWQPALWLFAISPYLRAGDVICFGHLANETANGVLYEAFSSILKGLELLSEPHMIPSNKNISLAFPLESLHKSAILKMCVEWYGEEILHTCTSCSVSGRTNKWCGICTSCQTMKGALFELAAVPGSNYKGAAARMLRDNFGIDVPIPNYYSKTLDSKIDSKVTLGSESSMETQVGQVKRISTAVGMEEIVVDKKCESPISTIIDNIRDASEDLSKKQMRAIQLFHKRLCGIKDDETLDFFINDLRKCLLEREDEE